MTADKATREARRRAFRAIDETCPEVQSICDSAQCDLDHEDVAMDVGSIHSEIESQMSSLLDVLGTMERSSCSEDGIAGEIASRVTEPFRDSLVEAFREVVYLEEKLADVASKLERSAAVARTARFAIRLHFKVQELSRASA